MVQEKEKKGPVVILGVGNILLRDEGVGVHVVRALQKEELPPGVEVYEGGTAGIDLLEVISRAGRLIVVDAVDGGEEAGTVFRFRFQDLDYRLQEPRTSLHQIGIMETLKIARFLNCCPETVIIGVQPSEIAWGMELSPVLAEKLPVVVDLVKREVGVQ